MDCTPPGSSVHGDSPGKNTGVGGYSILLEIFRTQGSNPLLANSSPSELPGKVSQIKWLLFFKKWEQNLSEPMDCSLPGSSIHGILQARILEWVAISLSRGSSQPRDQTLVFHTSGRFFTIWATKAARWLLKAEANWNLP